ncbi:MAG: hypothetical protein L6Q37_00740 [Bdellovibrionaceae bacterium]|nr:hypothetical protein [Pseudobdellovibrionaceae bacterium]NUM57527.1 hypothetical protein [Pseudobdellovibrionaceae bacterium]
MFLRNYNCLVLFLFLFSYQNSKASTVSALECVNGARPENRRLYNDFERNLDLPKSYFVITELRDKNKDENSESANENDFKMGDESSCQLVPQSKDQISTVIDFFQNLLNKAKAQIMETITFPIKLPQKQVDLIGKKYTPYEFIKLECINNALKRDTSGDGYSCESNNRRKIAGAILPSQGLIPRSYGKYAGNEKQCVTEDMSKYTQFVINSALDCLSDKYDIDPSAIFRKFNNESGFNYSIASSKGVGFAQLTTPAIKDMLDTEITHGRKILSTIAESDNHKCDAFKKIAKKDLTDPPAFNAGNYCSWIATGNGLARSAIYSIGYYIILRERYLIPQLKKRNLTHIINNETLLNKLIAVAYSSEGAKEVYKFLDINRFSSRTPAAIIGQKLDQNSQYLKNIKEKMREVLCLRDGISPASKECQERNYSRKQLLGEDCVGGTE